MAQEVSWTRLIVRQSHRAETWERYDARRGENCFIVSGRPRNSVVQFEIPEVRRLLKRRKNFFKSTCMGPVETGEETQHKGREARTYDWIVPFEDDVMDLQMPQDGVVTLEDIGG